MSKNAVYCIAQEHTQAEVIVNSLKDAGFSNNDISVLFPDKTGTRDFAHEQNTKMPEGAATGGVAGMGIPELEAKQYDDKVRNGNILISVHTESSDQIKVVKEIFERANAHDIKSTSESHAPT